MRYLALIFILLFSGCSIKNYEHTQSKIIIIKSPLIKFSDLGYIRNSDDKISLELFMAGVRIQKIDINHLICADEGCMTKRGFNKDYLNKNYPDDLLQNILLSRPIFDDKNLIKTDDGFEQKIIGKNIDIIYKVSPTITYFKDKKNRIIIKIKEIQ
ncbi:MAG: hypothetical protein U9P72_03265 [Campylobacterota bacterium]|nr:hypothetical protein [Campylobacterota bacterium]